MSALYIGIVERSDGDWRRGGFRLEHGLVAWGRCVRVEWTHGVVGAVNSATAEVQGEGLLFREGLGIGDGHVQGRYVLGDIRRRVVVGL